MLTDHEIRNLKNIFMEKYLVELSTDEAKDMGLKIVRLMEILTS